MQEFLNTLQCTIIFLPFHNKTSLSPLKKHSLTIKAEKRNTIKVSVRISIYCTFIHTAAEDRVYGVPICHCVLFLPISFILFISSEGVMTSEL